ncbi:MAG: glycine--tRNA ligase subunit beta [Pseudomonadota bacterium]
MSTAQLFVEVRCEELPAGWGAAAAEVLAQNLLKLVAGVPAGRARSWHSTRRIAAAIDDLALARPTVERVITGPPWAVAFKDGAFTRAAEGFARGRGVGVEALFEHAGPKGSVVALRSVEGGEPTAQAIAAGLEQAILSIPFKKTQRWGDRPERWARPIHGVCAVLGGELIEASVAGIATEAVSMGHRRARARFPVRDAEGWLADLRARFVLADAAERRAVIARGLAEVAAAEGVGVHPDEALLAEVTDLVEWPVPVAGRLPAHLMHLPPRLLVESMRVHQRIFDTRTMAGALSPVFITVSNNPHGDAATIAAGNTRVLAARFEDARFFFDEDRKRSLEQHGAELARMRWIRGLGTMEEKGARVAALAQVLCEVVPGAEAATVARAGALCKADLCTQMVGEFPELQGHVGMLYARHQGEPEVVAQAIEDHYLPRFAGDALPQGPAGRALALADRLDTIAGCFAVGLVPKGGADPQGLRRAANGVVLILRALGVSVDMGWLAEEALRPFLPLAKADLAALRAEVLAWLRARLRAQLLERHPTEIVDAVIEAGGDCALRLSLRTEALAALAQSPEFAPLRTTFRRVVGLTRDHAGADYSPVALAEPAEQALHVALGDVRARAQARLAALDYRATLAVMTELKAPVDTLFDDVLVMADDPDVRRNRLGLLRAIADLFRLVADFSRLSTEG